MAFGLGRIRAWGASELRAPQTPEGASKSEVPELVGLTAIRSMGCLLVGAAMLKRALILRVRLRVIEAKGNSVLD